VSSCVCLPSAWPVWRICRLASSTIRRAT
jgi:hypothetical protein